MNSLYIIVGVILLLFVGRKMFSQNAQFDIQEVNPSEAKKMISSGAIPLDVRTPGEVAQGKIKNAMEINVATPSFKNKINKLDKSKTYVVYCRSGRRSMNACNIMKSQGFENVVNLRGGFMGWK